MDTIRSTVKGFMRHVAQTLDKVSGSKITPNAVTITGLLAHLPIAWLIATRHPYWAALLLVIFGLFDTLDGELARLQHRDSAAGMMLDAVTDRMKEIILYTAVAYAIVAKGQPYLAIWAVVACGCSLLVSYVKAKGETAVKDQHLSANEINRLFQDGLMRFEVRMGVLVIGLLVSRLVAAVVLIALLSAFTAVRRLLFITNELTAHKET
jgi:CDP-diacylglycerol--glycerol-3-phosphate 3-phosphatidyltransferase